MSSEKHLRPAYHGTVLFHAPDGTVRAKDCVYGFDLSEVTHWLERVSRACMEPDETYSFLIESEDVWRKSWAERKREEAALLRAAPLLLACCEKMAGNWPDESLTLWAANGLGWAIDAVEVRKAIRIAKGED